MHFRVKSILKNNHYRTFKNFFILLGAFNQYKNYILILFWEVIEKSKTRLIKIERHTEREKKQKGVEITLDIVVSLRRRK
jgi:hypothetical protein